MRNLQTTISLKSVNICPEFCKLFFIDTRFILYEIYLLILILITIDLDISECIRERNVFYWNASEQPRKQYFISEKTRIT